MRVLTSAIVILATGAVPCGGATEPECTCPTTETPARPGPQPVEAVPTSVTAFLGYTELAATGLVPVSSMKDFHATLGGADTVERGFALHPSMELFFLNGGTDAVVVSVGTYDDAPSAAAFAQGLTALDAWTDPGLIAMPDAASLLPSAELYGLHTTVLDHCAQRRDRFCLLDLPSPSTLGDAADGFRAAVAVADPSFGAAYVPWLELTAGEPVPPSGAIAGIYGRVDRATGVWRAPANEAVNGITGLVHDVSDRDQKDLLSHPSGMSINPVRTFPGQGPLVWGARTLDSNGGEWQYVSVRRLSIFLEQSIRRSTGWVVFEPNAEPLWTDVQARVDAFLFDLWREGGLAGATPEEAYRVHVGLGESMTQEDVDAGRVVISVVFAPVRPAEFVVLTITQGPE